MRNKTAYALTDLIVELRQLVEEIEDEALHIGFEEGYEAGLKDFDLKKKGNADETQQH